MTGLLLTIGTVLFAGAGVVFAVCGLYQFALAAASFRYVRQPARTEREPWSRLVVLVPAHDEAALIARCVTSLLNQSYPRARYRVVVIADNCSDGTDEAARSAGATVLVRTAPDARGKGRALRWAMDHVLREDPMAAAFVVVDADSLAEPDFLERISVPFERGATAVQGESLLIDDGTPASSFRAAAFLLINRVRPAGRAVLGLPSNLAGNGMLFARELLLRHPWDAFSSTEDLEYMIRLRTEGIRVAFAGGAILNSPTAPTRDAVVQQEMRWEGGKLHVARAQVPALVAAAVGRRRLGLLDAAVELALPPLGLLTAGALLGTGLAAVLVLAQVLPGWVLLPWVTAVASIPVYVLLGLRAARAPSSAYRALWRSPIFVARKLVRAHRLLTFRPDSWVRTERAAQVPPDVDREDTEEHSTKP